jgi:hypothetical protein
MFEDVHPLNHHMLSYRPKKLLCTSFNSNSNKKQFWVHFYGDKHRVKS